jgi:hypothetical protein
MLFSCFGHLGGNGKHAIWLIWIALEIILVIFLGRPEGIYFF